jgi:Lrp/AsnC family transcriptional regulator for asnA, asnC and gidA
MPNSDDPSSEASLSSLDRRLIALLQRDARRTNTSLAKELKVTESTIRRRIEWLIARGYIQIVALTEPLKLGYTVWVIVQVKVDLALIDTAAEALARMPTVSYVAVTTGAFDILFTAHFRSHADLHAFITQDLARIEGIISTGTSIILHLTKRSFEYGVLAANQEPRA